MTEKRAFQDEEVELTEAERACARHLYVNVGPTTADTLIEKLRKDGRDQAVLEVALLLPTDEYRRVEEVYREVDPPPRPKIRRRR